MFVFHSPRDKLQFAIPVFVVLSDNTNYMFQVCNYSFNLFFFFFVLLSHINMKVETSLGKTPESVVLCYLIAYSLCISFVVSEVEVFFWLLSIKVR